MSCRSANSISASDFADAGKNAFVRVAARRDDTPQFAAAHDVEAAAEVRQRPQHGKI